MMRLSKIGKEKSESEGREVPVYNGEDRTDVTYGDRIDAMRLVYNKINNKKNSAVNEKTGDEHYKLLVEAQTLTTTEGATIVTDAGMLVGTFDADKASTTKMWWKSLWSVCLTRPRRVLKLKRQG